MPVLGNIKHIRMIYRVLKETEHACWNYLLFSVLNINIPWKKTYERQVHMYVCSTQVHTTRVLQPPPPANLHCAASIKPLRARSTSCTSKIKKPLFGNQCTVPVAWAEQTCQLSRSLNNHSFGARTAETALTQIAESQHWHQALRKIQRNTLCSVNSTVQNLLRGGYVPRPKKRTGTEKQGALCWAQEQHKEESKQLCEMVGWWGHDQKNWKVDHKVHPGAETLVSISHDYERGSGSTLGVKLGENNAFWEDSGDHNIQRAPEKLFIKSSQAAGAPQTAHSMHQTQHHFSGGMKTDSGKHSTLQTPRETQRMHLGADGNRCKERIYRKHHNFTRDAVRKTQFKDYCNNTSKSNSLTWKLQNTDWQLSEIHVQFPSQILVLIPWTWFFRVAMLCLFRVPLRSLSFPHAWERD